jgi:hypothetical protein
MSRLAEEHTTSIVLVRSGNSRSRKMFTSERVSCLLFFDVRVAIFSAQKRYINQSVIARKNQHHSRPL